MQVDALPGSPCPNRPRWVVQRTFAWLHALKRLRTRYERRADIHHALLTLTCVIICLRKLRGSF